MVDRCFDEDDPGALLERVGEPEVRAHLSACPACRTRLASYRAFLAGETATGPAVGEAVRDLDRRIAAMTGTQPSAPRSLAKLTTRHREIPSWLPRPRLVGAALAASCVAVVLGLVLVERAPTPDALAPYRGNVPPVLAPDASSTRLAAGGVRFTWEPVPGASAYRVRVLAADLTPLLTVDATADTLLRLDAKTLARLAGSRGEPLLWDVAPIVAGDLLAPSTPRILPPE